MTTFSWTQTTLSKGDIAIISISTGGEDFAFVTFVDLQAGTVIYFTDEEADGDLTMNTGEGTVQYTAPAGGITAGTVVTGNSSGSATDFSSTSDGSMTLGNSGDGIIAYQGTSVSNVTTFLHAVGEDGSDVGTFPGGTLSASDYILMANDDGNYTGTTSGTAAALFSAINDNSNWTVSGSASINPPASFSVIGASSPSIGFDAASSTENETDVTFSVNIPVTFTNYDAPVTVSVTVDGSSTAEGGDYTLNTTSLVFNANGTQNISLDINNDADSDNETVVLNIAVSSGTADLGTSQHTVTITDDELPTASVPYSEDFSDCNTQNWTVATVGAELEWTCGNGHFEANAFGSSGAADDYLISPSFNMDAQTGKVLTFSSWTQYADASSPQIQLLYTTNYTGDPSTTSWNSSLSPTWPASDSQTSTSSGNVDVSGIAGTAVVFAFRYTSTGTGGGSTELWRIEDFEISLATTWTGSSGTDWATLGNWSNGIPTSSLNAIIPDVTNAPIISAATGAEVNDIMITEPDGLSIASEGSLRVSGTASGNITYTRALATNNWYLVSSPVVGETIEDLIANHTFDTGTGSNIGISTYANDGTNWNYSTAASTGAVNSGTGYAVKLASAGNISFTGTIPTSDVGVSITSNTNGFNLIGNPFPSYIAANDGANGTNNILRVNDIDSDFLTEATLWFWNQSTSSYDQINQASGAFYIAPGQGFFVSSNGGLNTLSITEAMQSHQINSFQRNNTETERTKIELIATNSSITRSTKIYFINGTTTGFDNGYDSSIFSGVNESFSFYTHAVADGEGKKLGIQSLPNSDYENMIIPIGVDVNNSDKISFSINIGNLPSGYNVYLEDKETGAFINLNEAEKYDTNVNANTNGIGRFYLHVNQGVLSSGDDLDTNNLSIYQTSSNNIRVVGLQNGTTNISLYNTIGQQVFNTSFEGNSVNDINIPSIGTGIYIIKLDTTGKSVNKKIIIE